MTTTSTNPAPVLEHIDPKTLTIGVNIRSAESLDLTPEFLASIEANGVLVPIVGHRSPDGESVVVDYGQRRTVAAVKTGRPTVPVMVYPTEPDTVSRITDQWAENHDREAMNTHDELMAVEELALFGLPADQIAKTLGLDETTIVHARKVASHPEAVAAATGGLSLEYAALLADFPEADPDDIMRWADDDYSIEHATAALVQEREDKAEFNRIVGELAEQGISALVPMYPYPSGQARLSNLTVSADDKTVLTEETHKDCRYRAVTVDVRRSWKSARGEEGAEKYDNNLTPVCTNWVDAGHGQVSFGYSASPSTPKVPASELPDDQREALAKERRNVIASNKAWKEATSVRTEWLSKFGAAREPKVGAEKFVGSHLVTWIGTNATHLNIVGLDRDKVTTELTRASAKRALHLVTCIVVGSIEDHLTPDAWRSQIAITGPYLDTLSKWGYGLADVEKKIVADAAAAKKKGSKK